MIEFLEGNRDLALGRVRSKEARTVAALLWRECAETLNAEGPSRTGKEWAKVWNDNKCRVRAKLVGINDSQRATGGGPSNAPTLTPLEERIANIYAEILPTCLIWQLVSPSSMCHCKKTYNPKRKYNSRSYTTLASSKQLRRLWCNIKQRDKSSMKKLEEVSPSSNAELPTEDTLEATDFEEEEIDTPYFVNVGGSESQDDTLNKLKIRGLENTQEKDTLFTAVDSEGRPCNVEFIDELEEDVKPTSQSRTEKDVQRVKSSLLLREYQNRKRRLTELHILQKRLLTEQIREARAKANLAELELKQQQFLET